MGKGILGPAYLSMQMCVLMITGFVVADAPAVNRLLKNSPAFPRTGPGHRHVALIDGFLCWLHWGVGMMGGIMLAATRGSPEG
jgi:short-chain fatty acids transporter